MWSENGNNKKKWGSEDRRELKKKEKKKKDKIKKVGSEGKEGKKWGIKDDLKATIWNTGNKGWGVREMRNIEEKANSVKTLKEDKYYTSTLNQQLTVF